MKRLSPLVWTLLVMLTAAVAGLVHVVTVLALPWRASDDAFARVAALAAPGTRAILGPADTGALPFRDPAMLTAVCRFDLSTQPFRIATTPFADGFVTVGFHSRHGIAFYGLTVQASDESSLELVLGMTPEERGASKGDPADHQVGVAAPEPEGFVVMSTPVGDGSERDDAEERLRHFACRSGPPGT